MPMLSRPSFGPKAALIYVTLGALLDVWTVVWYFAFRGDDGLSPTASFWVIGLFLTGLTLVIIGLVLGPLGRSARQTELPPVDATRAEAQIQATGAANPNPVVPGVAPGMAAAPGGVAPGMVVTPGAAPPPQGMTRGDAVATIQT